MLDKCVSKDFVFFLSSPALLRMFPGYIFNVSCRHLQNLMFKISFNRVNLEEERSHIYIQINDLIDRSKKSFSGVTTKGQSE